MAYPPPTLATNRTNATPQMDTHAADHNALALAVNDITKQLTQYRVHVGTNSVLVNGGAWSGLGIETVEVVVG